MDAVFLGVGMGPDTPVSYPGDDLPGVWDSLPFIEAIKTGVPLELGLSSRRDRRRQHRNRRRARDAPARRRRRQARLSPRRGRDARVPARDRRGSRGGRPLPVPERSAPIPRPTPARGVECQSMRLGDTRRERPWASRAGSRRPPSLFLADTAVQGDRPATSPRAGRLDSRPRARARRGARSTPRPARRRIAKFFAGGDAVNGGVSAVEAVRERQAGREGDRRVAAMNDLTEIRWHARAGQGAKTASQVLALALLRSGKFVQAFPEYGPERRGAPLRAYTRSSSTPIRRHDAIEHPDVVVVLEPSLIGEANWSKAWPRRGRDPERRRRLRRALAACGSPACRRPGLAGERGSGFANVTMLGAVAAALGEPPPERRPGRRRRGARRQGRPGRGLRAAVEEGYECLR